MRLQPLPPTALSPELLEVHNQISKLIGHSQGQVSMIDAQGALLGPFPPMLHFPQFGIPALSFIRTLDTHATLPKAVREVAILTVAAAYGSRFELYAHQTMAAVVGLSPGDVSKLASGGSPAGLNEEQDMSHTIARTLVQGRIVPDSTYHRALKIFGEPGTAELFFLVASYSLIAIILNGFDVPAPPQHSSTS